MPDNVPYDFAFARNQDLVAGYLEDSSPEHLAELNVTHSSFAF